MSIPASNIVQINPGVIGAGGNALNLNGLIITTDPSIPIDKPMAFPSATAVADWFGLTSVEADMATIYFKGRNNATVKPASLLFAQYNTAAVGAYLRSASWGSKTLTDLQAINGVLTVTFNGVANTSTAIDLSAATSFSDAATIIAAAFTAPVFSVSYDTQRKAFLFESTATGATETVAYATGAIADALGLTQSKGAALSQGADAATPTVVMDGVFKAALNWGAFTTTFEPADSDKLLFAAWESGKKNRFLYAPWDSSAVPTTSSDSSSFVYEAKQSGYGGVAAVYVDKLHAAFILGCTASLDFTRTNGRTDFAFKYVDGLTPSVSDETIADNLENNGYNFIGAYATANENFKFLYPGQVTGDYKFIDSYVNQIRLNSQLQLGLMTLLTTVNSVPYNSQGDALIHAACLDAINESLNFGTIRTGVALSALQAAEVNSAAGRTIDDVLSQRGWYLEIDPATAQTRGARQSPPMSLWYMDGGSVQRINLPSIVVL